ncbi:MAG TPA: hypothetical protein VLO11_06585 [Luteolibacter sp.]|nr:hypothetical protein [Luteolibacter sp.]
MKPLDVSPLPCMEVSDDTRKPDTATEGFVEDAVVLHLLTAAGANGGWQHEPVNTQPAGALDYAGWPLPTWQARAV